MPAARSLLAEGAVFGAGDIAVPMSGSVEVLMRFRQMRCVKGKFAQSPRQVDQAMPGLLTIKDGEAVWVEGEILCPAASGAGKRVSVNLVVSHEKVATFTIA